LRSDYGTAPPYSEPKGDRVDVATMTISVIAIATALVLAFSIELRGRRRRANQRVHRHSGDQRTHDVEESSHEFMSPAWIAMARREITLALKGRDLGDAPFTMSEEFTDAPEHLRNGRERIGFSVRIADGTVEIDDRPASMADLRVISDYDDALALARDPNSASSDPVEAEQRLADGRLRLEGDPTRLPLALQEANIHTLLARHTS
jgi:hypothetical protein